MKKILLYFLMILPSLALAQSGSYIIKGRLTNVKTSKKVYLKYELNGKEFKDSTFIKKGQFTFKGLATKEPILVFLILKASGKGVYENDVKHIYLEPGVILLNGKTNLKRSVASGTPTNVDNEKLNVDLERVFLNLQNLNAKLASAPVDSIQNQPYLSMIYKAEKDFQNQKDNIMSRFVNENRNSFVSLYALDALSYSSEYQNINKLYQSLSRHLKRTSLGLNLLKRLPKIEAIALGASAPNFQEPDTTGKNINLSEFRGKYLLIEFWASWCVPCRAENANLVKVYNDYKDRNFDIISVSLDGTKEKSSWVEAIRKDGLTWTQVSDLKAWEGQAAKLYSIIGLPQNFLVDPNGKIVAKSLRGDLLLDALKKYIR